MNVTTVRGTHKFAVSFEKNSIAAHLDRECLADLYMGGFTTSLEAAIVANLIRGRGYSVEDARTLAAAYMNEMSH